MFKSYYTAEMRPDGCSTYVQCQQCGDRVLNYENSTINNIDQCVNCRNEEHKSVVLNKLPHKGQPKHVKRDTSE